MNAFPAAQASCPCYVILLLLLTGCHSMPAGDLARATQTDIYLLRGWQDLYSTGIDQLQVKLEAEGYRATVYRQNQWKDLANAIATREAVSGTIVLVGFSYGADHAIDIARKLDEQHIRIPLLITLDPVTPPSVPANVAVCYNLYQSSGLWDIFPWFRGIPLKADSPDTRLTNIDVHQRPDLNSPDMAHKTIAGSEAIHREIIQTIRKHTPRDRM
jgi:pimeloyl-ACP methyl ester carboxylesterase